MRTSTPRSSSLLSILSGVRKATALLALVLLLTSTSAYGRPSACPTPQGTDQEKPEDGGDNGDDPEAADEDNHDGNASCDGGDENKDHAKKTAGDPVAVSSGAFTYSNEVLNIPGRGMDFSMTLQYLSSAWTYSSKAGTRWSHSYEDRLVLRVNQLVGPTLWTGPVGAVHHYVHGGTGFMPPGEPGEPTAALKPLAFSLFHYKDLRINEYAHDPLFQQTAGGAGAGVGTAAGSWSPEPGVFTKIVSEVEYGFSPINLKIPKAFSMRHPDGTLVYYGIRGSSGCISQLPIAYYTYRPQWIEDRAGNRITFNYDALPKGGCLSYPGSHHRLAEVIDTYGRAIQFAYDTDGWLNRITDFSGRQVNLAHDTLGNLTSITLPPVATFPAEAPTALTTPYSSQIQFQYSLRQGTNADSGHNVVAIIDPNEVADGSLLPYVRNIYDTVVPEGFRVVRQMLGSDATHSSGIPSGGVYDFIYDIQPSIPAQTTIDHGWFEEASRTAIIDPNGNVSMNIYDEYGLPRLTYEFTGQESHPSDVADVPTISQLVQVSPENWPPNPGENYLIQGMPSLGSFTPDPKGFITRMDYNVDHLVTVQEGPDFKNLLTYDTDSPDRFQRANLLVHQRVSSASPQNTITTAYAYEPYYNQIRVHYDPRGLGALLPPNGGQNSPSRYAVFLEFDFQEGLQSAMQALVAQWDIDESQSEMVFGLSLAGISVSPLGFGLGDINGAPDHQAGNLVRSSRTVYELQNPLGASPSYAPATVQNLIQYSAFSLPIAEVDPLGVRTEFSYYPDSNPTGSGNPALHSATDGGQLAEATFAAGLPEKSAQRYEYDLRGGLTLYRNPRGIETTTVLDELGREVTTTDASGETSSQLFDQNENVTHTWVSNSRPQLDAGYRPVGTQDLGFIETRFVFDIMDHEIERELDVDSTGTTAVIKSRYDKNGFRVLTLYPEFANDPANVRSSVFDEAGHLFTSSKGGVTQQFASLAANSDIPELATIPVDPLGLTTNVLYYDNDRVVLAKDGLGLPTMNEYDGFNRVTRMIDGQGNSTEIDLDEIGQARETRSYDSTGLLLAKTAYVHDELGRGLEVRRAWLDASGTLDTAADIGALNPGDGYATRRQVHDAGGNNTLSVDDNAHSQTALFDPHGRPTRSTDAAGNYALQTYDENGNLIYVEAHTFSTDPGSPSEKISESWFFHDELDRLVASVNALGHTVRRLYDSQSNLAFQSDAKSTVINLPLASLQTGQHADLTGGPPINDHGNVMVFKYDHIGYPLATDNVLYESGLGGGIITKVFGSTKTYDLNGRLLSDTDASLKTTQYQYDSHNRNTLTTYADQSQEQVFYHPNGTVDKTIDANGTVVANVYDTANRLTLKSITPGAGSGIVGPSFTQYAYDGLNRPVTAANDFATITRTWDSHSNLTSEGIRLGAESPRTTTSQYDGEGNRVTSQFPGGQGVRRDYTPLGLIEEIMDLAVPTSSFASFEYQGTLLESAVYGNGTSMSVLQDAIGRLKQFTHIGPSAVLDSREVLWDRSHNKVSRNNLVTGASYTATYDSLSRLLGSNRTYPGFGTSVATYDLDDVGNRMMTTGGPAGAGPASYTSFGSNNLLNQYTSTPFGTTAHDTNGNLTLRQGATLSYDYGNRLSLVSEAFTSFVHEYTYGPFGRRLQKVVQSSSGDEVTRYYYTPGQQVCEEQDEWGATLRTFCYGRSIDEVVRMWTPSEEYYYHTDEDGSQLFLTDTTGNVVAGERYEYVDYGTVYDATTLAVVSSPPSSGNPYFFVGRRLDFEGDGLYFNRNRHLDANTGRFLSRDPIGIWGDLGNHGNGYTYAGNNPWTLTDPLGLWNSQDTEPPGPEVGNVGNREFQGDSALGDMDHHGSVSFGEKSAANQREEVKKKRKRAKETEKALNAEAKKKGIKVRYRVEYDADTDTVVIRALVYGRPPQGQANPGDEEYNQGLLDGIQLTLSGAGLVPGFGIVPDGANAAISLFRGDFIGFAGDFLAAIPVAGLLFGGINAGRKAGQFGKAGRKAVDILSGKLKREFPSQHLSKSLNEIKQALKGAKGAERKSLKKAKKLLEQQERLRDKLN